MGICVSCRRRDRKAPEKRSGVGLGAGGPAKGPAAAELLPRRVDYLPAMANSISNIKMTNPIKGIVSKRRKRYIKDGFNLDLAYITDRLIAMGFPAEKLEGVYRNHIDEVYRFLEQMHKDHYKIYNLCSERSYDTSKFQGRVERYAFEDHTPPNMELIQPFCEDVHKWLSEDSRNVAAVHCKAGKGRTGTMVCCYLLYSGQKATADEALQFYGTKRTHDEKGVTIPSQRRYVEYYAALVRSGLQYAHTAVYIRELVMCPPPMLNGGQCTLELTVSQAQPPFKAPHGCHEVRKHARAVRVCLTHCTPLSGDVRVDVYNKPKMMMRKEKLFHFWFNTFFLVCEVGAQRVPSPADSPNQETYKLTLNKWQLDDAHKDKQHKLYSPDFKVELIVQKQPDTSTFSSRPLRAPSPPSSSASDCSERPVARDDDSEHWDSGEHAPPPPPPLPPLPPPPLHSAAAPRQDHTDPCDANLTHSKSDASKRSKYKSSKRTVLDDPSSQRNCSAADSDDPPQCSYKQDCKVRLAGDGQPYKELVYRLTDPIVGSSTYTKADPAARCAERNCDVGSQVSTELECELLTSSDLASGRSSRAQSPRDSNMDADRSPNTSDAPGESFETMFTEPSLPHPDFYRSDVFADDRNFRSTIFQTDLTIDQNYIRLDAPTKSRTLWGPDVKDRDYSEDHMFFDFSGNRSTKPTHAEPHRHPDDLSETSLNKNKPHKLKYTTEPSCKQHKSPKSKFDKSYRTYPEPIDRPTVIQDSKLDNKINTDPNMKSDRKPNPDSPPDMFLNADKTFSPNFKTDSKNYIKFTCIPPNSALTECKFKPGDPYSILPDVESKNRAYPNVTINQEFAKHDYDEQNQSISRTLTEPCCKADKPSIKSDYHLLAPPDQPDNRTLSKPRLSLTDVKASWREFSGKFSDNRKKRDKD